MVSKILPEDEPENNEKAPHDPKNASTGEKFGDNNLDELRQAMADSETKESSDVPNEQDPIAQSSVSPFSDSLEPDEISGNEPHDPDKELSWDQIMASDTGDDDDLTKRINSLRSETSQGFVGPKEVIPPFVSDELFEVNKNNEKLSEKIRSGSLSADTIGQIITGSTTEAEAIFFARELGIDWSLIPKETREEKTQFLIDYFKEQQGEQTGGNVPESGKPQAQVSTRKTENDWAESDSRLMALKETLVVPKAPEIKQHRPSFFTQLYNDFEQSSRFVKALTISLSILVVVIILAIGYDLFIYPKSTPVQPTPYTSELPFPKSIQLTGGWELSLNVGSIQNGIWNPTGAEWLKGTDLCRMVSLPWNKQLDAVYQTFAAGDELMLGMSNADQLYYKIESLKTLNLDEVNQLMNRNSPCVVVVLTKDGTDLRQVAIGVPDYVKSAATPTPATPAP